MCNYKDMRKKLITIVLLVAAAIVLDGCALMMPDQLKWEAGVDESGHYNGMKTGFSWNLPQPK